MEDDLDFSDDTFPDLQLAESSSGYSRLSVTSLDSGMDFFHDDAISCNPQTSLAPMGLSTFCIEFNQSHVDQLNPHITYFQIPQLPPTPDAAKDTDLLPLQHPGESTDLLFIPQVLNTNTQARALEVELSKRKKQPIQPPEYAIRPMGGKDYSQMKNALQSCFNTIRWISKDALIEALRTTPEFRTYLDVYAEEINTCPSVIIQVKNWVGLRNELEGMGFSYTSEHLRRNLFPKIGFSPLFSKKHQCMDSELNSVFWIDERDRLPFWAGLEDTEVLIRRSNSGSYNIKSRRRANTSDASRVEDDALFLACRPVDFAQITSEKMIEFRDIFLQSFLKAYLKHVGNPELGEPFSSEQALISCLERQFDMLVADSVQQKDIIYVCSARESTSWTDVAIMSMQCSRNGQFADLYISQCVVRPEYQRRRIATTMIRQTVRMVLREHPELTDARISGCCRFVNISAFQLSLRNGGNDVPKSLSTSRESDQEQSGFLDHAIVLTD
eukprot:TRINITY_DN1247_c0_g2_i1.p1 TRINITY_DN1247_c0_g2~~TRINITY_DN1247_c0_g2_i1.p1  ORF type:complete len:498 (+),score=89.26 TRINITY_DN1247_c0_g2_i1:81-1574(+)